MLQSKKTLVAQGNYAPVAVTVAGIGIIATCVLSLVMLLWDLGLSSFGGWIGSSVESWDSALVLLTALVILW
ncbi:MAG: YbjO family protein [Symbiopectobacterium sp.]